MELINLLILKGRFRIRPFKPFLIKNSSESLQSHEHEDASCCAGLLSCLKQFSCVDIDLVANTGAWTLSKTIRTSLFSIYSRLSCPHHKSFVDSLIKVNVLRDQLYIRDFASKANGRKICANFQQSSYELYIGAGATRITSGFRSSMTTPASSRPSKTRSNNPMSSLTLN